MTDPTLPLGRQAGYPNQYQPELLFAIARSEGRGALPHGVPDFDGVDLWNAWELTWLGAGGRPVIAAAEIEVPANSPRLIESKSLKLYLGSLAMSQYDSPVEVQKLIARDLQRCAGCKVTVRVLTGTTGLATVARLPGFCLDSLPVNCSSWSVDASLLQNESKTVCEEHLHSHLLRSLCPVTTQPDLASIAIHYRGPKIDRASLLRYIVSFREHNDFHEACVERIFVDIQDRCQPQQLSVYARFQRRGGIDINPFRSNFENCPGNPRLWRQ